MTIQLSTKESARLSELESVISKGQKTFIEVGHALVEIKTSKLYRQKAHTFDEYCQNTFGWGKRRASQICAGVGVWENAKESGQPLPQNEHQARKLLADAKPKKGNNCSPSTTMAERVAKNHATTLSENITPKKAPCSEFSSKNIDLNVYVSEPRVHTTPEDTALAQEFAGYPKNIELKVTVTNEKQESKLRTLIAGINEENGDKEPASKTPARDLIRRLTSAYKELTGNELLVSGADAGQVQRLVKINGASRSNEIVLTFRKACQATTGFHSTKHVHQIASFLKFYGEIRNEISEGGQRTNSGSAQKRGAVPNHAEGF